MLARHPFYTGLTVLILTGVMIHFLPREFATLRLVRLFGLLIFCGTLLVMFKQGLDREEVPYFFLGGLLGLIGTFFLFL